MINRRRMRSLILVVAIFFAAGFCYFSSDVRAETAGDVKDDIESIEKKLKKEQSAKSKLEEELAQIQNSVYTTQAQINKFRELIKASEDNILRMEKEVEQMNNKIDLQKEYLKKLIQEFYFKKQEPILVVVALGNDLSKFLRSTDDYLSVEERIMQIARDIYETKDKIKAEKEEIAEAKEEHEKVLENKVVQQHGLLAEKAETQEDIQEKEATIGELRQKLAELQSDLAAITGEKFDAKDINEAISFASKKTGVPKGILFAFLTQESGRNKNTGQCTYDDMEEDATDAYKRYKKIHGSSYKGWNYNTSINRLTTRKGLFEDLVKKLGYKKSKKISCAIIPADFSRYEPNQGGAMGVAQFMSDTWLNSGLQSQIKYFTGHSVPDPWSLTDGTIALAIKVRDAGGTSTSSSAVKKMVARYYGASPDSSSVARNYYNNVMYYIKNYDKLVNN